MVGGWWWINPLQTLTQGLFFTFDVDIDVDPDPDPELDKKLRKIRQNKLHVLPLTFHLDLETFYAGWVKPQIDFEWILSMKSAYEI